MAWLTLLNDLERAHERQKIRYVSMEYFGTYEYEELTLEELRVLIQYVGKR